MEKRLKRNFEEKQFEGNASTRFQKKSLQMRSEFEREEERKKGKKEKYICIYTHTHRY